MPVSGHPAGASKAEIRSIIHTELGAFEQRLNDKLKKMDDKLDICTAFIAAFQKTVHTVDVEPAAPAEPISQAPPPTSDPRGLGRPPHLKESAVLSAKSSR